MLIANLLLIPSPIAPNAEPDGMLGNGVTTAVVDKPGRGS
jgi:hypothetical protein